MTRGAGPVSPAPGRRAAPAAHGSNRITTRAEGETNCRRALPALGVHASCVVAVGRLLALDRPPERHDGERHHSLGDAEQRAQRRDALLERMDAEPHGPQAEQLGLDQQILGAGRAVLFPQHGPLGIARVAADDDGDRRRRQHLGVGVPLRDAVSVSRSRSTTNCHGCWLPADGAAMAARSSRSTAASSTGWSVYLRMLRRLRTGSSMLTSPRDNCLPTVRTRSPRDRSGSRSTGTTRGAAGRGSVPNDARCPAGPPRSCAPASC